MLTLDEAKSLQYGDVLHSDLFKNADGTCMRWRVNGAVKTWKRSPERVRVPIKHGLYDYDYVYEGNLDLVHREEDCDAA